MEKDGHHFTYISNDDRPKILQYSMVFSSFQKTIFTASVFNCSIFSFLYLKYLLLFPAHKRYDFYHSVYLESFIDLNYNSRIIIYLQKYQRHFLARNLYINNSKLNFLNSKPLTDLFFLTDVEK